MSEMIAVSWTEFEKSGCVNCGCDYCYNTGMCGGGTNPVRCGECETYFVILADGLEKSTIGWGSEGKATFYPVLHPHPRKDIPKHAYVRPDLRPDGEGEFWSPRSVGYDLAGFVKSKQGGERIVEMVKSIVGDRAKTWLDYRPHEPAWIQVKFQGADGFDLEKLQTLCEDGIITLDKMRKSLKDG